MSEKTTIALIGAGGKMGGRIIDNLSKGDDRLLLCEHTEHGIARIRAKGLDVTPNEEAVPQADYIVMAVPDALIGAISKALVPLMKPGATLITLDPAAAYAGQLEARDDCTFVVTHPCHPPLFGELNTPEERADVFGGIAAKQDIVIALHQGEQARFEAAERICIRMFSPVVKCHRVTVEQMAIMEPAMAEVVAAMAASLMKEALDETIKLGVPEEAARAFMLGHVQIPLNIVFNGTNPFSDAAQIAIQYGYEKIIRPDWKQVFTKASMDEVLRRMLHLDDRIDAAGDEQGA
ncbi:phosphogluconate dehydrogenase C-terminal domain-containing protein [Cohnella sp. GCM10027633]|uniref:phosphogluconate dehydrogenase C-terminal domain-containing protein n=1 Tax=unclassified Cohnella TaxID=2636738 RepID=UPI003636088E